MKALLKPNLKTRFMSGADEKLQYIELTADLTMENLEAEIKNGAVQYSAARDFLRKANRSQYVYISSDCFENGLMTMSYIQGIIAGDKQNKEYTQETFSEDEILDIEEDGDCIVGVPYLETPTKIPVIFAADIESRMEQNQMSFPFGNVIGTANGLKPSAKPVWEYCKKESVCIIVGKDLSSTQLDILDMFRENRHVYVLYNDNENDRMLKQNGFTMGDQEDTDKFVQKRNTMILQYSMDEVEARLPKAKSNCFFNYIAEQALLNYNASLETGLTIHKIVRTAKGVMPYSVCTGIDRIVSYLMRDHKGDTSIILTGADLDTLDRFETNGRRKTENSARERLESSLFGLEGVKAQVLRTVDIMKFNKLRRDMGLKGSDYHNVHVMLGAPGTAKTTVAKLMGEIMTEEGLLPDRRVVCINGAQLKGQYVGHSAPKTKHLFDKNDVIIIDEAYSIVDAGGQMDSFGNEAIAQLIIELENHSRDKLVIFAGYGGDDISPEHNKMQLFLDANPGIQSRIASTFYFPSYTAEEMLYIFKKHLENSHYSIDSKTDNLVQAFFETRVKARDFGNGREARNLAEACSMFTAQRILSKNKEHYTEEDLTRITYEDAANAVQALKKGVGVRKIERNRIGFCA